ncbi:hypothetical protein [Sphingobacterium multivorum]|uniref:hypothetical protein n=1 Tax=Sphingobacterium multivorum TaxID=28454 RepID=UPI00289AB4EF|nr:hypothetical protein [Sphingobacterium multivorum]
MSKAKRLFLASLLILAKKSYMDIIDYITIVGYHTEFKRINQLPTTEQKFKRFDVIYDFNYVQRYNGIIRNLDDITDFNEQQFVPIVERSDDVTEFIENQINSLGRLLEISRFRF